MKLVFRSVVRYDVMRVFLVELVVVLVVKSFLDLFFCYAVSFKQPADSLIFVGYNRNDNVAFFVKSALEKKRRVYYGGGFVLVLLFAACQKLRRETKII